MFRLVALGLLLLSHSAFAADACLTGASLLGDQRGLAALRTDVDAACPCATASSRKAFQKCARGRIDAAVAGASLRAECQKSARTAYRNTTCGASGRVACGRVDADGDVSCRVKKPAACRTRGRYAEHGCSTITHCTDVVDWTAGTCADVRVEGAHHAGSKLITFTKQSVADPNQTRPLATYIWYPTDSTGPLDPGTRAIADAPLAAVGAAPLIMFSHGSCGFALQSTFLTTLLASRGFIVVAPPHPGNTLSEFPACGTPTNQAASFQERPQDIIYVLDQMLAANQDPNSFFFGAIDPSRLGMSGHSFGGLTTELVVNQDARFVAALPMAPATPANTVLHLPSLTMTGAVDTVVNNTVTRSMYTASDPPKLWAQILNAGHFAFSNSCFPNHPDCAQPARLTQPEANTDVLRYAIPFLEVYVAGDDAFRPFLDAPAPAGFAFESVTP